MIDHMPCPRPDHVTEDQLIDFNIFLYRPGDEGHDFFDMYRQFRSGSVPDLAWSPYHGGHWIATRADAIREVFEDHERFSSKRISVSAAPGSESAWIPTSLDPPQHAPYRRLLNSTFAPKRVRALEEGVRALANTLMDDFAARDSCEFKSEFADILPSQMFLAMADLPLSDAPMLQEWSQLITRPKDRPRDELQKEFIDYLRPVVVARRGQSGEDLISAIANGEVGGSVIPVEDALKLTAQVIQAGMDTVSAFLCFVFLFLAENPDVRRRIAAQPEMMPRFLDELFRRFGVVTIGREVVQDMEYRGARLKAGDVIMCPTALSGLDERVNPDPFVFDLDRSSRTHSAFGDGPHRCPGAPLAQLEIRVVVEVWLKRIPDFSMAPDTSVQFTTGVTPTMDALPLLWDIEAN